MTYASGRRGKSVCERCGFQFPYRIIKTEPGTLWRVCPECNDGEWSLVSHPQNKGPMPKIDQPPLEHPRPDIDTSTSSTWDIRNSIYFVSV